LRIQYRKGSFSWRASNRHRDLAIGATEQTIRRLSENNVPDGAVVCSPARRGTRRIVSYATSCVTQKARKKASKTVCDSTEIALGQGGRFRKLALLNSFAVDLVVAPNRPLLDKLIQAPCLEPLSRPPGGLETAAIDGQLATDPAKRPRLYPRTRCKGG